MLFKKDLPFGECKEYMELQLRPLNPSTINETTKSITYNIRVKNRTVNISLIGVGGRMTVDVTDSYFLLRIPKETFNKIDKYKQFVISLAQKLYDEFGITE